MRFSIVRISFGCHRNYYTLGTLSNRHLLLIVLKTGGGGGTKRYSVW